MRNPVIVAGVRTPIGKAVKGSLANFRPDDLAGLVMKSLFTRTPGLTPDMVDDIVLGCAMPEGEQGMNVANIAKFAAGFPFTVPAMTVNRFCSSGLQSIAIANDSIAAGRNQAVIGGGMESMSMIPMGGGKIAPNPDLVEGHPEVYMSMGLTAERVAAKYGITREAQDQFALESHRKAVKAIEEKRFAEEIVLVEFEQVTLNEKEREIRKKVVFAVDEGPRADTSLEALAKLKPAFKLKGTVTAGNASQLSDGAAAVLLMDADLAVARGLKPFARLAGYAVSGVEPELMGMGPASAIPKVLKACGLSLKDISRVELNEAFAAQALAVMGELDMDPSIVNVSGGAIALGHPLGATGGILTVKLIHELRRNRLRYGLVSMCIGGGMGAAAVIENLQL